MNDKLKQQLMDDLIAGGECAYKTEVKGGAVTQTYLDPIGDELRDLLNTEPPDRSQETFEQAVERYRARIPKNETPEQRMQRITKFRCGY